MVYVIVQLAVMQNVIIVIVVMLVVCIVLNVSSDVSIRVV